MKENNMNTNTQKASNTIWDYIIIGTGMGGSVLGLSLAKAGKKVLFCEKGLSQEKLTNTGNYAEAIKNNQNTQQDQTRETHTQPYKQQSKHTKLALPKNTRNTYTTIQTIIKTRLTIHLARHLGQCT